MGCLQVVVVLETTLHHEQKIEFQKPSETEDHYTSSPSTHRNERTEEFSD